MIPASTIACGSDLALGIAATFLRIMGSKNDRVCQFAQTRVRKGGELPAIAFEQVIRFLHPSLEINPLYPTADDRKSYDDEEEQTSWVRSQLAQRVVHPAASFFSLDSDMHRIAYGRFYSIWALLLLGRSEEYNRKAIWGLRRVSPLASDLTEASVIFFRRWR